MNLPAGLFAGLRQRFQKMLSVTMDFEDCLTAVTTVHDVVDGSRILNS
jgi:hypothetical protein